MKPFSPPSTELYIFNPYTSHEQLLGHMICNTNKK